MDVDKLRQRIREIAGSPKNVRFDDICGLLDNHIGPLFANYNHHGSAHHAFTVGNRTFTIARPHHGRVKGKYVEQFLEAMEAVGLYDPEEEDA